MAERTRIYCCLKKINVCNIRIELKSKKINIGTQGLRVKFNEYIRSIGSSDALFEESDFICSKHRLLILKKSASEQHFSKKRRLECVDNNLDNISVNIVPENHENNSNESNINECEIPENIHTVFSVSTQTEPAAETVDEISLHSDIADINQLNFENALSEGSSVRFLTTPECSESEKTFVYVQACKMTEVKCFLCGSKIDRKRVPWSAIQQVWFKLNYYIPKSNRACNHHFVNGIFTEEALKEIQAYKQGVRVEAKSFGLWLLEMADLPKNSPINLEIGGTEHSKYKMLFGITYEQFGKMITYVIPRMRNTKNRTIRDSLGMFLLTMRQNMKQEMVAFLFNTTQQVVSEAIESIVNALEQDFVSKFLGYRHISRDAAIRNHSRKLPLETLGLQSNSLVLVIDCTYAYIEKPADLEVQRLTWSLHKNRNLYKIQLVVFPDGYILDASGIYYTDRNNNDATILKWHCEHSDLLLFLEDNDTVILDRGYRDVVGYLQNQGINVCMPELLPKNERRFSCDSANSSRKVFRSLESKIT